MEYFKLDKDNKLIKCNDEDVEFVTIIEYQRLQQRFWTTRSLLKQFKRDMTRWLDAVNTESKDLF